AELLLGLRERAIADDRLTALRELDGGGRGARLQALSAEEHARVDELGGVGVPAAHGLAPLLVGPLRPLGLVSDECKQVLHGVKPPVVVHGPGGRAHCDYEREAARSTARCRVRETGPRSPLSPSSPGRAGPSWARRAAWGSSGATAHRPVPRARRAPRGRAGRLGGRRWHRARRSGRRRSGLAAVPRLAGAREGLRRGPRP